MLRDAQVVYNVHSMRWLAPQWKKCQTVSSASQGKQIVIMISPFRPLDPRQTSSKPYLIRQQLLVRNGSEY